MVVQFTCHVPSFVVLGAQQKAGEIAQTGFSSLAVANLQFQRSRTLCHFFLQLVVSETERLLCSLQGGKIRYERRDLKFAVIGVESGGPYQDGNALSILRNVSLLVNLTASSLSKLCGST